MRYYFIIKDQTAYEISSHKLKLTYNNQLSAVYGAAKYCIDNNINLTKVFISIHEINK